MNSILKLIRKLLIIILLGLVTNAWCQPGAERSVLNCLRKHKWEKARQKLTKIMQKDSTLAGGRYVFARYFFSADNPAYNIDSAYLHLERAKVLYPQLSSRRKGRLKRLSIDSISMVHLEQKIDSVAFQRARKINTEESYALFIDRFPTASQKALAIQFRDESAYQTAVRLNASSAFAYFLKKYPESFLAAQATEKYHLLLFQERTHQRRLINYENFVRDFPDSPHYDEAVKNIFEIMTAPGEINDFLSFLKKYPACQFSSKARNIAYCLAKESNKELSASDERILFTDSLKTVMRLSDHYLVPFLEGERFGFMDGEGRVVIKASANRIDSDYLCGNVMEEVLIMDDKVVARNGKVIYQGHVDELNDLGWGVLSVKEGDCLHIIHKSGYVINDQCCDDVRILAGRYLALKNKQKWSILAVNGKVLMPSAADDIIEVNNVIALKSKRKWHLITPEQIGRIADQQPLKFTNEFDEVKSWPHQLIWVKLKNREGLLRNNLTPMLPADNYSLEAINNGVKVTTKDSTRILDYEAGLSSWFLDVRTSSNWVSVKTSDGWSLFDPSADTILSKPVEEIYYKGVFAVIPHQDTLTVYFDKKTSLDFNNVSLDFIPGKDSCSFLLVDDGRQKIVFDTRANRLFQLECDGIQYTGAGVFVFSKKEKKGLVDSSGKILLLPDYDAIGEVDNYKIPLLKKMKFGLLDIHSKQLIKPSYDKNLKRYNNSFLIAFKNGNYGLITSEDKIKIPFEYQDITYWSDSIAIAKKNFAWVFINILTNEPVVKGVKNYHLIKDTPSEKIAIILQEGNYGVVSNVRGIIIPNTFTDIINLGTPENPLYFTEKNVEEASIFVVIYYDKEGKLIRRQVFEPAAYEKVYCSGK